jgi:elongator complex protein 3
VRGARVEEGDLRLAVEEYDTDGTVEQFLACETAGRALAGFLRLSFPRMQGGEPIISETAEVWAAMPELRGAALIREVHVYGPALGIGADSAGEAQHLGLGRRLIGEALGRARAAGFARLAVISAIGTRRYYEAQGFERGELYMAAKC